LIASLLFAGYDTTRNQLGIALFLFTTFPEQWRLLAERPELAPNAVEEILRFQGTVTVAPRIAFESLDIGEYHVPPGTIVSLSTAAANHDPAVHVRPAVFDITVQREARSPSAAARTTAWARTSRGPRCRKRSCSSHAGCPTSASRARPPGARGRASSARIGSRSRSGRTAGDGGGRRGLRA
jgi:cytochrome P450